MISTALGVLTAADAATGGKFSKAAKKNAGKFIGKYGKKITDFVLPEGAKKKLNNWIDKGTGFVEKVLGDDSEITRNLKNFRDEMKGENTEWRRYDDKDEKSDKKELALMDMEATGPYIRNLYGTNYKRYIPRHKLIYKTRGGPLKRIEVQRHSKFSTRI